MEKMKDVETPNDNIRIITQKDRIIYLELFEGKRKIFSHLTQEARNNNIDIGYLPLYCLRSEPNGDRIRRELGI